MIGERNDRCAHTQDHSWMNFTVGPGLTVHGALLGSSQKLRTYLIMKYISETRIPRMELMPTATK